MVQDEFFKKQSKHAEPTGEPPAKKFCVKLGGQQKFSIAFNGSKNGPSAKNGASEPSSEAEKPKTVKRVAPQDNLSAQVYPRQFRLF
ncbi:Protein CBG27727 [Caenorhabditis briggsae]|uniref:Uncharacterized protein n=2 Tax=Caenorhabditis briggsae TaxID=6238 RepID=A0AAE8ZQ63_CAEBR|nr:Protein CBG27727 [Caenorhabditis briggsae]ULT82333.1 hypothetical protein L3Y34_011947 [Caenorhabditis briggsae]UMM41638.1 hypothetical protein L5515_017809 [Caenorhabditis briggsae]CAS00005.1 Protein CBG27727 [Caenorhabditis briggsae]